MKVVLPVSRGPKSATLVWPFKISATWLANASMPTIFDGSSTGRSPTNGFKAFGIGVTVPARRDRFVPDRRYRDGKTPTRRVRLAGHQVATSSARPRLGGIAAPSRRVLARRGA